MAELKRVMPEYLRFRSRVVTNISKSTVSLQVQTNTPREENWQAPNNNLQETRCYNCRGYGHVQMACPQPRRPPGACFHAIRLIMFTGTVQGAGNRERLKPSEFHGIGNKCIPIFGKVNLNITFYDGQTKPLNFLTTPDELLPATFLLGRDFLKKFNIGLRRLSIKSLNKDKMNLKSKDCVSDLNYCVDERECIVKCEPGANDYDLNTLNLDSPVPSNFNIQIDSCDENEV